MTSFGRSSGGHSIFLFLRQLFCLLLGFPVAFFISTRPNSRTRQFLLFLILLPFWTNFLVRTYALQTILGREGPLNALFLSLGVISEPLTMLNTQFAVMLGLVYGFVPFMVLPIYAAAERLDFRFVEAAGDLGANDFQTFWRVIVPLTDAGHRRRVGARVYPGHRLVCDALTS